MAEQKFERGDLVKIDDDLGPHMSHFRSGIEAIVVGSYADQFGRGDTNSFSLLFQGSGESSWYCGDQLTLIEAGRLDLMSRWEGDIENEQRQKSDRDWIFENGPAVADNPHGASIATLAKDVGIDNLWGSQGEGVVYMQNAMRVMALAEPFLRAHDKDGWLEKIQSQRRQSS